jgi:hypothetical protein
VIGFETYNGSALWTPLRGIRSLKKLRIEDFQTRILRDLPSVPQIKEVVVSNSKWNFDLEEYRPLVDLEGVQITFCNVGGVGHPSFTREMKLWKSLPFVKFE